MIAEYTVKRNGRWYKAGDEIPGIVPGEKSSGGYTKTEINRMSTADLQAFATEQGIDNAEELTGAELKKLKNMLDKWDNDKLTFTPTCPRSTYNMQIKAMTDYIAVLEARAVMENVEL